MRKIDKMSETQIDKILNKYTPSDYEVFSKGEIIQLINIAHEKENMGALGNIAKMCAYAPDDYLRKIALDSLNRLKYTNLPQVTAEQHSQEDLGEIYTRINYASRVGDSDSLRNLKTAGIILGHIGVVEYASQKLNERVSRVDVVYTLKGAIENGRGYSLDDAGTSVGRCYQALFGNSYLNRMFNRNVNGVVTPVPYSDIPTEDRKKVNQMIIGGLDFSALEKAVIDAESRTIPTDSYTTSTEVPAASEPTVSGYMMPKSA